MNISRITMVAVPLLLVSSSAFADPEDKKKTGAQEPETPIEEPKAETPPPAPAIPPVPPPEVGTTTTTAAYPAERAEPPAPTKFSPVGDKWELEPLVGYGTDSYNFGVGGRIGYTFAIPVYLGANFMWHAGSTNDVIGAFGGVIGTTRDNFYYPSGELGYDFGIGREGRVMIRPYAGAGALFNRHRATTNNFTETDTNSQFMVYPGLTVRYNFEASPAFIGADTKLIIPTDHGDVSYGAFFVAGLSM